MSSAVQVPAELLAKYGTQGPRYTSYPTAPHFTEDVDREALAAAWTASGRDLSLYMHLPFCEIRCLFCGCHVKVTRQRGRSVDYVDRVLHELDLAGRMLDLGRPLQQVQLGGGTPNFLLPEQMRRLIEGVRERTRPAEGAEWSIECDPRTMDADYAALLLDLGFNRFSLGVQDLAPEVMEAVNRHQGLDTVTEVVGGLRSRGPVPLNFDLIYGLPRQTVASWTGTIDAVLELRPTRLAVYGYAHVPWKAKHQAVLGDRELPDPELRAELARLARVSFVEAGYEEIGMDHYALPDDELSRARRDGTLHRNFMGYTTRRGLDQLALGTSAISHVGASYAQDRKDLPRWQEDVDGDVMPWERGLLLSDDDLLRGEIITELSCNGRVDLAAECARFGESDWQAALARELEALDEMAADALLTLDGGRIELTAVGRFLVRNVCMVFDAWLERDRAHDGPRYSNTV